MALLPGLGIPASHAAPPRGRPAPAPNHLRVAPSGEPGFRLLVSGVVTDGAGRPLAGARLHVYQTDANGRYTFDKPMDEAHARLAGYLTTDAAGRFEISTIRPGGYPKALVLEGRERKIPAHIHIDVRAAGRPERRLQAVFADDPLLADPYWMDWVRRLGQPVLTARKEKGTLRATLALRID
jgi:protocatechuate 3,4-dioxygenase beta subunit